MKASRMLVILSVSLLTLVWAFSAQSAVPGASPGSGTYGATNILASAATKVFTKMSSRNAFNIQNKGPNSIYCGFDSAVTTSTGTEVTSGSQLAIDVTGSEVYCIAATADQSSPSNTRWIQVK